MRVHIAICYGLTGVLNAVWGATLPATDARLDLGVGRLGVLLMALAVGALVAMPIAGRVADRWDGRRLLGWTLRAAAPAPLLVALAPSGEVLIAAAMGFGVLSGGLNVALSLQAVAVERALGRPVMGGMHGTWTLGAVLGGALATAGLRLGLGVQLVLVLFAGVLVVAGFAITRNLPTPADQHGADRHGAGADSGERPGGDPSAGARPGWQPSGDERQMGLVVGLGLVGAAAFLTEGAATDWAGVHATRVLGADPAVGSLVYTAFFVAMTVVRFVGDPVRARLGATATIRYAGATATAGYGLVLLSSVIETARVGTAMAGWILAGAGMAVVWPVVVSALGASGASGRRLSMVTTISYGGGLVGPALIGAVAGQAGLPVALLIPGVLAVVVAGAAPVVLARCLVAGDRAAEGGSRGGGSDAEGCDETGRPPAWVRGRSM
ncbi:MFS transporter [Kribbella italica]|uniref:MFS family permease n=1 Tax=Kribbella italica TaxID=1540520 RepID=A0A7W9J916_9ACTN|nr:MFS transporter [Kribbella italica]MBB5837832.1 MFS family permease [Kribbella italica]